MMMVVMPVRSHHDRRDDPKEPVMVMMVMMVVVVVMIIARELDLSALARALCGPQRRERIGDRIEQIGI
jgi:hypothetical protein